LIQGLFSEKNFYAIASISCLLILAVAFWLERNYLLAPCPLCMIQRIMLGLSTLIFISLYFYQHKALHGLQLIITCIGAIFAGRQVWLQQMPSTNLIHSCVANLKVLVQKYSLIDFIKVVFKGGHECSKIDYTLAGLSLAAWSLLIFVSIGIINAYYLSKKRGGF
jgi:disulfide bond formation protein DsbB